jgi:hypothetical protein
MALNSNQTVVCRRMSHWQSQWHPFVSLDSATHRPDRAVALNSNQTVVCRRFATQLQNRCTTAG